MSIYNCAIHFVEKKADGSAAVLQTAPLLLEQQDFTEQLLAGFITHYNAKPGKALGLLRPQPDLSAQLQQLLQQPDSLLQLSQQLAASWRESMDNHELFLRGYLCFLHYRHSMSDYLALALIPPTASLAVTPELQLQQLQHLDLSQLQLAMRINLSEWHNNQEARHYASWLKAKGGKKLLDAFAGLFGAEESIDAPEQTSTLLQAFGDYVEQSDLSAESSQQQADTLVRFASEHSRQGQPLALSELSQVLDEDNPQAFYNHIRNKDYGLSPFVPADRRTLSQFRRFSGRAEGMSISFEAHLLGSRVEYDSERDTLIIRNPPTQLKDQLQRKQ